MSEQFEVDSGENASCTSRIMLTGGIIVQLCGDIGYAYGTVPKVLLEHPAIHDAALAGIYGGAGIVVSAIVPATVGLIKSFRS